MGFGKHIGYFITKPQNPKCETFGVQFKLKYTEDGIVIFDDCNLIEEWTEETKIPKKKETKPAPPPVEKKEDGEKKEGDGSMEAEKPAEPEPQEEEFEIKKVKKEKQTQIKFEANTFEVYSDKEVHDFYTSESTMLNQDRIILETYERKNEV